MSRRASKKKSSRKTGFFKWLRRQFGMSARPVLDARRLWFQDLETRRLLVAPIATYSDGVMAPFALAFDTSGNLYVANEGNNPGTVEKFAPGTTTPGATYNTGTGSGPGALAFDSSQNLYVGDEGGNVLEFAPNTTTPSATYPGSLGFNEPFALAIDSSNNLYVANYGGGGGNTVFRFAPGSTAISATYSGLAGPAFLLLDSSNNLYVANGSGTTVEKFAAGSTSLIATYSNGVNQPYGLAFDSSHNLYVANFGNNTVEKFAPGSATPSVTYNTGEGSGPDAVAVDSAGNVYVSNLDNNSVVEFAAGSTTPSVTYTSGINGPEYLALDSSGNLYVANGTGTTVEEFASAIKASKLQVSASPSSLSAGSTTSVTITAEDSSNNVVTGFSDSVTLSDSLGGASFSTNPVASFTNGVATITATLDKAGTQTITATDTAGGSTVTAGTSSPITVTPAAASKLLVSASPSSLTAGNSTSVSITAEDKFNNIVTGFSDSVTLSDGLGGASFSVNPVASFTGGKATVTATLDKAGTQTVTANDASATIVGSSNAITVAPGAATQLLVTTQPPSTVTAGMGFGFTVTAEDAEDNVATGFNGSETVALHDSPFGGTLSGTLTSSAAGGIATFTGLSLNKASTDYRLAVTSGTLTSAPSSWITVVPGTATQLLITSQPPSTVTAYSEFNFTVTAEDGDGNADPNFDGSETVALAGGPMGGTLGGTPTVSATAGVATFNGLVLDTVGGYTLSVTSGTLTSATSSLISVTPVPASGSEFQVNTYTPGNQQIAKVAMDAAGDYVIVWQSYYYNVGYGAGYNIYAQRYNASGAEQGSQFQVNTYTGRDSTTPSVAMDSAGDFVVAWVGYDGAAGEYGVYAQQYNASGATQGSNFLVNTYTALSNQLAPSVAMDSAGDFVVAWNTVDEDGSNYGVYAQLYSASGATNGTEFRVNTYTPGNQFAPSAAMDSAGDFVIAWSSYGQDGSGNGVFAQAYHAGGAPKGSEFQVNTYTTGNQSAPSVAVDSAGEFVVAWESGSVLGPATQDGSEYGVYAQLYKASGATNGSEFQVNTYTTGLQNAPAVAMDSAGDFVVVWQSPQDGGPNPTDSGQFGVYARAYNASGQAQASEFLVNTYTPGLQGAPAVARDSAGDFVVAWQSQYQDGSLFGVYAKRYQVPSSAVSKLVVSASPGTLTAGSTTSVTITAEDASNDVVTSFSDSVTLSDSLGGASFSANPVVSFTGGVATVTATLDAAGTQAITASDTSVGTVTAGVSNAVTVTPAAASKLVVIAPSFSEFQVNTYTTGSQSGAKVASDAAGDYVVTWTSSGEDGSSSGVYAQRYSASGVAQGSEFRVNTYTTGSQSSPVVAMDSAGDFVIAWTSNGQDLSSYGVYAQRYNAGGVAQGSEFRVNTFTTGSQRNPSVAMDSAGDFVIAWQTNIEDGSNYGVYAQRYNASGVVQGSEFRVNTYTTGYQTDSSVAMDSAGDFVIAWASQGEDGSNYGVYAQRYNASGAAQGSEFRVNTYTTGGQGGNDGTAIVAAMDSAGDFVVVWRSNGQDGSSYGVYAQRYNAGGVAQGSEFRVNTYTAGSQNDAWVAMDSVGDFVVTWTDYSGEDGSQDGVYAQRYNANGAAQGSEFRVNTYTTHSQRNSSVAMDSAGDFVVAWQSSGQDGSGYGVYAQRFVNLSAGQTTSVSIAAEDAFNNLVTGFADAVTLADSLGGATFGTVSFSGGVATVSATFDTAGTQTITATDTSSGSVTAGTSGPIKVTPAAASQLLVSVSPSTLSAGSTTSVTITAEDQFNNVVTGFSDSVALADTLGGGTFGSATFGGVTFSGSIATVTATLDTAGTQTITATDTAGGSTVTAGTSGSITVSPSAPPSFDLTISTSPTNNVSLSGGVFSATGGNPNINIGDLHTALVNNSNVVITNAVLIGDTDNIEWLSGANLDSTGIPTGHTLTIETAPTATAGNLSIASTVNLPGDLLLSGQSVSLNAAVNTSGTLWIGSGGAVSQSAPLAAANLSVAASGNVALTSAANSVSGELAIHDAAMGAYVEWLDADGFEVGAIAAASAAEDPQSIFGAVSGVSAAGNFIALENTSGNMLLGDGGAGEGVTATGGDVRLESAGAITQNSSGGGAISAGALGIVAGGNVELSQTPSTVSVLAVQNSSGYVRFVDSQGFAVGSVGPVNASIFPNAVHGISTVGGDIGLQSNSGSLTLGAGSSSEVVSATGTGGDVRLDSAGAILQTAGSGAITASAFAVVANGNVDLSESANTVFLVAISDSSGYVRLTDSETFIVGTVGGVSAKLDPNAIHGVSTVDADIGLETTNGNMILGNGNTDEVVSATGTGGDVRLNSAGYIVQNTSAGGAITAGALGIVAHGNVDLSESPNSVLVLSIQDSSGYVRIVNDQSLAIGSVGPAGTILTSTIHGVTTVNGDIALQTNAGSLQLGNGSSAEIVSASGAGGDVRLESAGAVYQSSSGGGGVTAAAFGVVAAGTIQLNLMTNDVSAILAIDDTAAGAVNFSDSVAFAQGTVGAISPKIFPKAITGVTSVSNNVTL